MPYAVTFTVRAKSAHLFLLFGMSIIAMIKYTVYYNPRHDKEI